MINEGKFKEIIQRIQVEITNEGPSYFLEEIELAQSYFSQEKTIIMIVGPPSSGKTTLLNSMLSYDSKAVSFVKDFMDLMITSSTPRRETYFCWIFEKSLNQEISIKFDSNEFVFKNQDIPLIKEKIIEICEAEAKKLQKKEIIIGLPLDILKDIVLIDCPPLTEKNLSYLNQKFIKEMAYLICVKDMTSPEASEENYIKLFQNDVNSPKKLLRNIYWIYTKKDKYIKENQNEQEKNIELMKSTLKNEILKRIVNIDNIACLDLSASKSKKGIFEQESFKEFISFLRNLPKIHKKLKSKYFAESLYRIWENFLTQLQEKQNQKHLLKNQIILKNRLDETLKKLKKNEELSELFDSLSDQKKFERKGKQMFPDFYDTWQTFLKTKHSNDYSIALCTLNFEIKSKIKEIFSRSAQNYLDTLSQFHGGKSLNLNCHVITFKDIFRTQRIRKSKKNQSIIMKISRVLIKVFCFFIILIGILMFFENDYQLEISFAIISGLMLLFYDQKKEMPQNNNELLNKAVFKKIKKYKDDMISIIIQREEDFLINSSKTLERNPKNAFHNEISKELETIYKEI